MTTNRITLTLQACEGMSDAELEQRGAQGFKKMIDRKRVYAKVSRTLSVAVVQLQEKVKTQHAIIANLKTQLASAEHTLKTLEQMDAPVGDTTQAASLLASITSKKDAS